MFWLHTYIYSYIIGIRTCIWNVFVVRVFDGIELLHGISVEDVHATFTTALSAGAIVKENIHKVGNDKYQATKYVCETSNIVPNLHLVFFVS